MTEKAKVNWRTASDPEIIQIIEDIAAQEAAAGDGKHFHDSQVRRALEAKRIKIPSNKLGELIDSIFHYDEFGPTLEGESRTPRSILDRVRKIGGSVASIMHGAPNLDLPNATPIVNATYRHATEGTKHHGIGRKTPK